MLHRATFALDELAIQRLKKLSVRWHISQAEVIRRALEKMENEPVSPKPDPAALLEAYHARGGLNRAHAEASIAQIEADRAAWRNE